MNGQPVARREELKGHLALLTFSALVAGSFSFGGRIANDIDPQALTAVRFLVASVLVVVVAGVTGQINRAAARAPWRYLVLGGLFGMYFVLMFVGLKTAHPVSIAAVFTLTPLMAAGFGWWIMRQTTNASMAMALSVGAAGALWVIFRGDLDAFLQFRIGVGEFIFFFGCMAHALYIPLVPRLNRGEPVLIFTLGVLIAGFVVVGATGVTSILATDWSALSLRVWATLGYLVVFATVASIILVQFASFRLKAAKVMAYTYLIPSWVILWEIVLDGDVPPAVMLPGVGLTVVALLLLLREGVADQASSVSSNS
ncbi:MAG: EamA family transporter [Boseongicola sp.]|nr:MAG: EamA family transporter [Boseongicola sp.]